MRTKKARSHESKMYCTFSRLYEPIFTRVCRSRIQSTIESLDIPAGARILDVGVGTGLSLSAYPAHAEVTGIDIATEMLAQAQKKVDENGWSHVRLLEMDALDLDFPDEHFDYVMAFHIVSVVPDFDRLMQEISRVSKPRATIVIINHFRSERKWLGRLVALLDPITRRLGWRTTIRYCDVIDKSPLEVEQSFKTSRRSLFTIILARTPALNGSSVDLYQEALPR